MTNGVCIWAPCASCKAFEAEDTEALRWRRQFDATRFAATDRATLGPSNLRRQFALLPQDLVSSPAASPKDALSRPEASMTRCTGRDQSGS